LLILLHLLQQFIRYRLCDLGAHQHAVA
jgi:hypothetical protein